MRMLLLLFAVLVVSAIFPGLGLAIMVLALLARALVRRPPRIGAPPRTAAPFLEAQVVRHPAASEALVRPGDALRERFARIG